MCCWFIVMHHQRAKGDLSHGGRNTTCLLDPIQCIHPRVQRETEESCVLLPHFVPRHNDDCFSSLNMQPYFTYCGEPQFCFMLWQLCAYELIRFKYKNHLVRFRKRLCFGCHKPGWKWPPRSPEKYTIVSHLQMLKLCGPFFLVLHFRWWNPVSNWGRWLLVCNPSIISLHLPMWKSGHERVICVCQCISGWCKPTDTLSNQGKKTSIFVDQLFHAS